MRSLSEFQSIAILGKGAFGSVQKAYERSTNQVVALKKVVLEQDMYGGFVAHLLREIGIQRSLHYDHIISVREVVRGRPQLLEVVGGKTRHLRFAAALRSYLLAISLITWSAFENAAARSTCPIVYGRLRVSMRG